MEALRGLFEEFEDIMSSNGDDNIQVDDDQLDGDDQQLDINIDDDNMDDHDPATCKCPCHKHGDDFSDDENIEIVPGDEEDDDDDFSLEFGDDKFKDF